MDQPTTPAKKERRRYQNGERRGGTKAGRAGGGGASEGGVPPGRRATGSTGRQARREDLNLKRKGEGLGREHSLGFFFFFLTDD